MLSSFYNRRKVKKSRELLRSAKLMITENGAELDSGTLTSLKDKTSVLERSIKEGDLNSIGSAYDSLINSHPDTLSKVKKTQLRRNVESVLIALLLALLIRTFIVQPFKIPSASMVPTLLVGDHLLVSKFIYGTRIPFTDIKVFPLNEIERGDVVVFRFADKEFSSDQKYLRDVHYIKRVIGVPGDKIDMKGREVYINDKRIEQEFNDNYFYYEKGIEVKTDKYVTALGDHEFDVIYKSGSFDTKRGKLDFPITVPEGKVFVMGDNRDNSYDSRFWSFLPSGYVLGKAFVIHWSWDFDQGGILNKVRWGRIFSTID